MSTVRKSFALLLALAMFLAMFSGCTKQPEQPSTPDTPGQTETPNTPAAPNEPVSEEPVKLSVCKSNTSWGRSVDADHIEAVVAEVEKATNTDIEVIAPPHNGYAEKVNILLTSGDIPDIYTIPDASDNTGTHAVRGYLAPLDDYIKNVPELSILDNLDMSTWQVKGVTYALPDAATANKIIWVRKDLADKYGLNIKEVMSTDEFKTEFLKVNQKEIVPFAMPKSISNFQYFHNAFSAYAGIIADDSGKYYDGFDTDEMRQSLTYLKDLYDTGVLDREFITNANSVVREKTQTGKAASVLDYSRNYMMYRSQSIAFNCDTEYLPIYKLTGPDGNSYGNHNDGTSGSGVSSKCENVQKALEVLAYMNFTPEGEKLFSLGIEGIHYTIEDGVITPTEKALASSYDLSPGAILAGHVDAGDLPFKWGAGQDELIPFQREVLERCSKKGELGPRIVIPSTISDLYDKNLSSYSSFVTETISKVILGNVTVDQAFEDYRAFWKSIQGDEMLAQLNA